MEFVISLVKILYSNWSEPLKISFIHQDQKGLGTIILILPNIGGRTSVGEAFKWQRWRCEFFSLPQRGYILISCWQRWAVDQKHSKSLCGFFADWKLKTWNTNKTLNRTTPGVASTKHSSISFLRARGATFSFVVWARTTAFVGRAGTQQWRRRSRRGGASPASRDNDYESDSAVLVLTGALAGAA